MSDITAFVVLCLIVNVSGSFLDLNTAVLVGVVLGVALAILSG